MYKPQKKPDILNLEVKPLETEEIKEKTKEEQTENFELPEVDEDSHMKEMFVQATKPQPKPKKKLSERQKAHMEKMRKARAEKLAQKKAEKEKQKQEKELQRREELKEKIENNKTGGKAQAPRGTPVKQQEFINKVMPQPRGQSNQEYMQDFFQNLNMFMDSYNKVSNARQVKQVQPVAQEKKKVQKVKEPEPKQERFTMLNPRVSYRNIRNPFS